MKVAYPSMWELMEDLRDMGETNAVVGRLIRIFPFGGACSLIVFLLAQATFHSSGHFSRRFSHLQRSFLC